MPIGDKFGSSWIAVTGPVAQAGKPAVEKKDEEVISGGDFVTKKLGIPVDIKCLYDKNGKLTYAGKNIQKHINFKKINDNEALFCGDKLEGVYGVAGDSVSEAKDSKFIYKFNKDTIKEIKFEETKLDYSYEINIKFFSKNGTLLKKINVYVVFATGIGT